MKSSTDNLKELLSPEKFADLATDYLVSFGLSEEEARALVKKTEESD